MKLEFAGWEPRDAVFHTQPKLIASKDRLWAGANACKSDWFPKDKNLHLGVKGKNTNCEIRLVGGFGRHSYGSDRAPLPPSALMQFSTSRPRINLGGYQNRVNERATIVPVKSAPSSRCAPFSSSFLQ